MEIHGSQTRSTKKNPSVELVHELSGSLCTSVFLKSATHLSAILSGGEIHREHDSMEIHGSQTRSTKKNPSVELVHELSGSLCTSVFLKSATHLSAILSGGEIHREHVSVVIQVSGRETQRGLPLSVRTR
jgi:hypothetical protein